MAAWFPRSSWKPAARCAAPAPSAAVTVASGGTLAPGNSPGTLIITAPVTLAAGSTTSFDIDGTGTGTGAGNYSRLIVTSTLSAGGTLAPLLRGITGNATNTFAPPIGQSFQVITASGGLTGSFSGLTQPAGLAANTRFDALYGADALDLVVTPASYASYAGTNWAAPVGAGLDAARPAAGTALTADQSSVYAPLYTLAAGRIVPALEQIAPLIYPDTLMVNRTSYQMVEGAVDEQLQARRGAPAATGAQTAAGPGGTTVWLGGSGQFINQTSAANGTPGYSGSSGGAVIGIDGMVLPACASASPPGSAASRSTAPMPPATRAPRHSFRSMPAIAAASSSSMRRPGRCSTRARCGARSRSTTPGSTTASPAPAPAALCAAACGWRSARGTSNRA